MELMYHKRQSERQGKGLYLMPASEKADLKGAVHIISYNQASEAIMYYVIHEI